MNLPSCAFIAPQRMHRHSRTAQPLEPKDGGGGYVNRAESEQ